MSDEDIEEDIQDDEGASFGSEEDFSAGEGEEDDDNFLSNLGQQGFA